MNITTMIHAVDSIKITPVKTSEDATWRDLNITLSDGSTVTITLFCSADLEVQL